MAPPAHISSIPGRRDLGDPAGGGIAERCLSQVAGGRVEAGHGEGPAGLSLAGAIHGHGGFQADAPSPVGLAGLEHTDWAGRFRGVR